MNEKFPKTVSTSSRAFNYFKEVWRETFPDDQNKTLSRMEQRKQSAKMQKEYEENAEHIENLQEQIPEWKRGAIAVTEQEAVEEKPGLFKRLSGKLTSTKTA